MKSVTQPKLLLAICLALTASAPATVIYRETFDNTSGQTSLDNFGWYAYYGSSTTNAELCIPGASGVPATAMSSGGPSVMLSDGSYADDINAGSPGPYPSTASGYDPYQRGFVTTPCLNGLYDILVYTSEYTIDQSAFQVDSVSFYATSSGTWTTDVQDAVYVAMQVRGLWYVSAASVTPATQTNGAGTTFTLEAIEFSLDADGLWNVLNFAEETPLTISDESLTALPSGDITAFGLFWDLGATSDRNTPRWDTFAISATSVPEPLTLILLAAGTCCLRKTRRTR